jgi:polyisoprenoid-binding protein YceI
MSAVAGARAGLATGTWQLDPTHSQVGFAVDYMGGTFHGTFSPAEARLDVDADGAARLEGRVRAADVKVQDEDQAAHLRSPEFFDAERTPELRFVSTDVHRDGDDLVVTGELTIKGASRRVELRGTISDPIGDPYGRDRIGVKLAGAVDRTDFGLEWNVPLPSGEPALANEVTVTGELYFVKA